MVIVQTGKCLYCGEPFVDYGPVSSRSCCGRCEYARGACSLFGDGDVADCWIAFYFGEDTLRRGRQQPWILRQGSA